mmetsp:Transcript_2292/g.3335  ORF Transcript_2292/g.3335 Transcript_2292/m.3335 type:complete len:120 (-) Transcript_2292:19-378(-)
MPFLCISFGWYGIQRGKWPYVFIGVNVFELQANGKPNTNASAIQTKQRVSTVPTTWQCHSSYISYSLISFCSTVATEQSAHAVVVARENGLKCGSEQVFFDCYSRLQRWRMGTCRSTQS